MLSGWSPEQIIYCTYLNLKEMWPLTIILHTFSEYLDRKLLLQTPVEQTRLLQEVPEVIADEIEVQSACKDMSRKDEQTDLPKSALKGTSPPPKRSSEGIKGSSCCLDDGANGAGLLVSSYFLISINKFYKLLPLLFFWSMEVQVLFVSHMIWRWINLYQR